MGYYMDGTTQVWEPDSGGGLTSSGMSGLSTFGDISQQLQANAQGNNAWSAEQAMKVSEFNAAEAAKNRDWQQMMSNTAHQREVADLKAAGLNPVLSATHGGATTPSGAAASGQKGDTDTSLNNALTNVLGAFISQENARLNAQTNLAIAERNNATSRLIAEISAAASMNSAAMHAAATRYASDQSYAASVYGSDKSLEGTQYSSDKHLEGVHDTNVTSSGNVDKQTAAQMYASDQGYNASIYGTDTSAKTARQNAWINFAGNLGSSVINQVGNFLTQKNAKRFFK